MPNVQRIENRFQLTLQSTSTQLYNGDKKALLSFSIFEKYDDTVVNRTTATLCVLSAKTCISFNRIDFSFHEKIRGHQRSFIIPYPTAFPYGNGMVLHFYQQQESSTTKTVHKVINKGLKAYV